MNVLPESRSDFCQICDASVKKYRCPVCLIQYCTLVCYRAHKPSCSPAEPSTSNTATLGTKADTPEEQEDLDKVPDRLLVNLQHSEELVRMLRDPALQSVLNYIDSAEDRVGALEQVRQKEGARFKEFIDLLLVTMEVASKTPEGFVGFTGIPKS